MKIEKKIKLCQNCGATPVTGRKIYCDECRRMLSNEGDRERKRRKRIKDAALLHGLVKPIEQCVREAAALGLTYGQYVARGLDKECL